MPRNAIRQHASKLIHAVWAAAPRPVRQRVQAMRELAAKRSRAAAAAPYIAEERVRAALRRRGADVPPAEALDLYSDADVSRAADLPLGDVLSMPASLQQVSDKWSGARFCIDLWRRRSDLRERFPAAFTADGREAFARWIRQAGAVELALSDAAAQHVVNALEGGLSDRARQVFLSNDELRAALPHGLTPAGMRGCFRWFMRSAMKEADLRLEEVWWLFLEAAQDPRKELMLAYSFAPAWQLQHPDGLTVFGREAFAAWFSSAYGARGEWVDASAWPEWQQPAHQLRISYWARDAWRSAHPDAFANDHSARAWLAWLASPQAELPEPVQGWCRQLDHASVAAELARPGANVIGHFCYPSGLRISAESMVESMRLQGVSPSLRDVRTDGRDDPHHVDFRGMECHDITIIHVQPEPYFDQAFQRSALFERSPRSYRIGYWYWEFDSVPDWWAGYEGKVDEVWAATEFVARGLRARFGIPVRTQFPGVKLDSYKRRSRTHFGVAEAPFTFLFTFHMTSVMERKNPLGLIRAFKSAFRADESVQLVLKTSFGNRYPREIETLRAAAAGANITVIDEVYGADEVLSLMDACDAYVSLHRSEGLGLTMAEAMLMGKPVIATNFSGNVDFMDENNSLLVPCELVKLGKPIPPYDANLLWAEPSLAHAAQLMRRVFENQAWAREVGARGKASAEANLSLEAAGRRIVGRLEEIKALRRATHTLY